MRVLLVEEDAGFALPCRQLLSALRGVDVVKAASTQEEACEWLRANSQCWDLAIVDLFLRTGHGFNVLRACMQRQPMQRAVVLSSYADLTARQYARKAGADAFFDRTSELDALVAFCRQLARDLYSSARDGASSPTMPAAPSLQGN